MPGRRLIHILFIAVAAAQLVACGGSDSKPAGYHGWEPASSDWLQPREGGYRLSDCQDA